MQFLWPICACLRGEEKEVDDEPVGDPPEPITFKPPDLIVEQPSGLEESQQLSPDDSAVNLQSNSQERNLLRELFCASKPGPSKEIASGEAYRYRSGAIYTGDWKNREPHGNGEMRWSSDRWYRGSWDSGLPVLGKMQLSPGVVFEGSWKNSEFHSDLKGLAELSSFNTWLQSVSDGFGTFYAVWLWFELNREEMNNNRLKLPTSAQEIESNVSHLRSAVQNLFTIIDQELRTDESNSKGFILNRSKRQVYRGCHIASKPHGIGERSYGPRCSYVGEFFEGEMQGFGVYSWPNGKSHSGWWRTGERHGYGVQQESNGQRLVAHWENGHLINQP